MAYRLIKTLTDPEAIKRAFRLIVLYEGDDPPAVQLKILNLDILYKYLYVCSVDDFTVDLSAMPSSDWDISVKLESIVCVMLYVSESLLIEDGVEESESLELEGQNIELVSPVGPISETGPVNPLEIRGPDGDTGPLSSIDVTEPTAPTGLVEYNEVDQTISRSQWHLPVSVNPNGLVVVEDGDLVFDRENSIIYVTLFY